jgi:hypothetical protein
MEFLIISLAIQLYGDTANFHVGGKLSSSVKMKFHKVVGPLKNMERLLRFLGDLFMKWRISWPVSKVLKDVGNVNSNIVSKRRVISDM